MGWMGDKYTWNNGHGDDTFKKERLDRVVANFVWAKTFKNMRL